MKRKRFTEEQMIGVLKEGAAGAMVSELGQRPALDRTDAFALAPPHGQAR